MSLIEMGSALRKRWGIIAASILIVMGLATFYIVSTPSTYRSSAQLYVTAADQSTPVATNSYVDQLGAQQRMSSYVRIAQTQSVLQPVIDKLELGYTWQHLQSKISVTNPASTTLLNVVAQDGNATQAADLANAVCFGLVSYITSLETVHGSDPVVKATLVQPATVPGSPASPRPVLDLVAAALIGIAIGVVLALIRDTLDTSIKTVEDIESRLGVAGLGAIPYDRRTPRHPILVGKAARSDRAESFRQLRTNLQFVEIEQRPRSILVTSAVAEEGKTVTACNLAIMLAKVGVDVILMDGDLRRSRVSKLMGVDPSRGLTSVLMGWVHWTDALQVWENGDIRLRVMAAAQTPPNPTEMLASERMSHLLGELEEACDVVIIDGPPLLPVADSAELAAAASGTVLIVRHGKTKEKDVRRSLAALDAVDARVFGVVLNMSGREVGAASYYAYRGSKAPGKKSPFATAAPFNGNVGMNGSTQHPAQPPATSAKTIGGDILPS